MQSFSFFSLLAMSTLFMFSCAEDPFLITEENFQNVHPDLKSYYIEFKNEATARGLNLDLDLEKVSGDIEELDDHGVAGVCQYGSAINNHITIDESFWSRATNLSKEMVVFHELGHCVLLRDHKEDQNSNGLCLSIMRSGTGTCIDAYSVQNREYYLDELFSSRNEF